MSLSFRWTLTLFVAALVLLGGLSIVLELSLRSLESTESQRWRASREAELRTNLESFASSTAAFVDDAASSGSLRTLLTDMMTASGQDPREVREWAGEQAPQFGLDELMILDGQGRIVSHSSWSSGYGTVHPEAGFITGVPGGGVMVWQAGPPDQRIWTIGSPQSVELRGRHFHVVGGRYFDAERLNRLREQTDVEQLSVGLQIGQLQPVHLPPIWNIDGDFPLMVDLGDLPGQYTLRQLRARLPQLALLAAIFILLSAPLVARGLARPMGRLVDAVRDMEGGRRQLHLADSGPQEVRALAGALDDLSRGLDAAEARMRAAERRAAWRDVARRIAHELKNALSPLTLALDNVETAVERDDEAAKQALGSSLATAREQLHSLDRLVTEFRSFARMPQLNFDRVDATTLCNSALAAAREARPQCRFADLHEGNVEWVRGDSEQLRRALLNLLLNAADAAPHAPIDLDWGPGPGPDWWWVAVRDRGPGLSPAVAARLGEPYLTTKEGGTGLGLTITFQVIEGHGGRLEARQRDGGGLVMHCTLPRHPDETPPTEEDA